MVCHSPSPAGRGRRPRVLPPLNRSSDTPPLFTRNFVLLCAGQFLQSIGFAASIIAPVYFKYLGASRAMIGAVLAASAVGGLLSRPLVGRFLDRVGRKPVVMFGATVGSAGVLLLSFTHAIGPLLFASMALFGVGVGAMFTAFFTFAADHIPEERRTEGIALFGVFGLLPLSLNAVIAIADIQPAELARVFPIAAAGIAASMLCVAFVPEVGRPEPVEGPGSLSRLMRGGLSSIWGATLLFAGSVAIFLAFATVTAEDRGIEDGAWVWVAYAAAAVSVRTVGAQMPDRLGPARLVFPSLLVYSAGAATIAMATQLSHVLIAGTLCGIGHGYCFPVLAALVATRAGDEHRGRAFALYTALWDVSVLAVRPLMGLLADMTSDRTMYLSAAIIVVVCGLGWQAHETRFQRNSAP